MRKNKTKRWISIGFIIMGVIILLGESLTSDNKLLKHKAFTTEDDRIENINKFQNEADISNPPIGIHSENSGGNQEIEIMNREKLIETKYTYLDGMLEISKLLQDGVSNLIHINNRCNSQIGIDKKLISFYGGNSDELRSLYGIYNYKEFIKFKQNLEKINKEKKIVSAEIIPNTLRKEKNVIRFELLIKTESNNKFNYKIKVIENSIGDKSNFIVKWVEDVDN